MKHLITSILLVASTAASAQYVEFKHTMVCNKASVILKDVTEKFKEQAMWMGSIEDEAKSVVFVNKETGSWTNVIFKGDTGCILSAGEGYSHRDKIPEKTM